MRKRYRVLVFAALVAALVVPVGYALSVESTPAATAHTHYAAGVPSAASVASTAAAAVAAPIAMRTAGPQSASQVYHVPDAAKLFGLGTVLIGLAAAVRKAV